MTDSSRGYQQFFAELKRRRVFRVMAMYGVVAFIVLQVAELVFPILELPNWTLQFVLMLSLLGFPIAIVLAWALEATDEGIRRTIPATSEELQEIIRAPASERLPAGLMALVGVIALVLGAYWVGTRTAADSGSTAGSTPTEARFAFTDLADDTRPSIAVLPFADMSPEGDQEYFSDGMSEEIINTLVQIRELRVAGRTSAFAYKGQNKDLREIGAELGVAYLVEGSVRKDGDALRITAQLIDAETGSHLWTDTYDRTLASIFQIQTEIAAAIAAELRVSLGLDDPADLVTPMTDLDAYDLYLAGRAHMRARGTGLLEAIRLLEAAIARDSSYAPAWASLAEAKEIRIWYHETFDNGAWDEEQGLASLAEAEQAARRALAFDPQNASALVALGSVQRDRGQWDESEATYRRALVLDPDNAEAHQQYSELLGNVGRIAEAVRAADRAAALDPAPIRIDVLGFHLLLDDRLSEALEVLHLGVTRDADMSLPRLWRSAIYSNIQAKRALQAIDLWDELGRVLGPLPGMDVVPTRPDLEAFVSGVITGDLARIPQGMREFMRLHNWMMVGEPDSAAAWLIRFHEAESLPWLPGVWRPVVDSVRSSPQIRSVMEANGHGGVRVQRTPPSERTRPMILGVAP